MDTKSSKNDRFAKLATMSEMVFHAGDASNMWDIRNKNTLYQTLSRYAKQGLIHRIHKGLYSLKRLSELNPYEVGIKSLHGFAYISCESVLFGQAIINQSPREITIVSGVSRRYAIGDMLFRSRKLYDNFLHNNIGIEIKNGIRFATLERAVADMLYFSPNRYFDAANSKLIDWGKVQTVIDSVGYKIKIKNKGL